MAEEGVGLFLDMLGKGIVFAPRPEQMVGTSRVGFAVHFPSAKCFDSNEGSAFPVDGARRIGEPVFNGVAPSGEGTWLLRLRDGSIMAVGQ